MLVMGLHPANTTRGPSPSPTTTARGHWPVQGTSYAVAHVDACIQEVDVIIRAIHKSIFILTLASPFGSISLSLNIKASFLTVLQSQGSSFPALSGVVHQGSFGLGVRHEEATVGVSSRKGCSSEGSGSDSVSVDSQVSSAVHVKGGSVNCSGRKVDLSGVAVDVGDNTVVGGVESVGVFHFIING